MIVYTGATFIAKKDRNLVGTIGDILTFRGE